MYLTAGEQFARTCEDCRAFMFKHGRKVPRHPGISPPCQECPKISPLVPPHKRSWLTAADLTEQMWQVWEHYKICDAVQRYPEDALFEACAAKIRGALDKSDKTWQGRNVRDGMGSVVGDLLQLTRRVR